MTGTSDKLDAFVRGFDDSTIIEVVRSGSTGISRGEKGCICKSGVANDFN
jgi:acetolactate synthase I/III small subunit